MLLLCGLFSVTVAVETGAAVLLWVSVCDCPQLEKLISPHTCTIFCSVKQFPQHLSHLFVS